MRRQQELFGVLAGALGDPRTLAEAARHDLDEVRLAELADFHRVAGQLAAAYPAAGLPTPAVLAPVRAALTVNHLQHLQALQRIGRALDAAGIRWLALKGPVLAGAWYHDPAARSYHDLDVLVDAGNLAAAIDTLGGQGFEERNRNWAGFRALGMGEVPLGDGIVTIDLHWHLLPFERDRRSFTVRTADVLDRRVPVALGSVPVWSLADDDLLAHVVLHAGLAGARLLVHLRDVHVVGARVDWPSGARRMHDMGMDRLAAATVARVEGLLGPMGERRPGPLLHHRAWRDLNRGLDRIWTATNDNADKPFPSVLLASARPTVAATATEVVHQAVTSIRRHAGLRTLTTPGGLLTWEVDAGGRAERDRFLRDVDAGTFGR